MSVQASALSTWQVLSRPDCSLCQQMLEELAVLLGDGAHAIQVCDISGDVELERKYGQRIPVLMIDGELVCAYRLDKERLTAYLNGK